MTNIPNIRQDEDGIPYLGYFDRDLQLGFCWNGHAESPIEVSHGGMGEPVVAEIPPVFNLNAIQHPTSLLREFRFVCNEWADTVWPTMDDTKVEFVSAGSIRNGVLVEQS